MEPKKVQLVEPEAGVAVARPWGVGAGETLVKGADFQQRMSESWGPMSRMVTPVNPTVLCTSNLLGGSIYVSSPLPKG